MTKPFNWPRGAKARIAQLAGIRQSHLSDILHRRRGVSETRGLRLQTCSIHVLGATDWIPWYEWVGNRSTLHPAFYGDPQPLEVK